MLRFLEELEPRRLAPLPTRELAPRLPAAAAAAAWDSSPVAAVPGSLPTAAVLARFFGTGFGEGSSSEEGSRSVPVSAETAAAAARAGFPPPSPPESGVPCGGLSTESRARWERGAAVATVGSWSEPETVQLSSADCARAEPLSSGGSSPPSSNSGDDELEPEAASNWPGAGATLRLFFAQ